MCELIHKVIRGSCLHWYYFSTTHVVVIVLIDWYSKSSSQHGENNSKLKQTLNLLGPVCI
jgi:hypothetical protein